MPASSLLENLTQDVGFFDEELHLALDYDLWLRIAKADGKIFHVQDVLASSRLYPETKTLSSRKKAYDESFLVSQRHGGYVDVNYFYGLWDHLISKRSPGSPTFSCVGTTPTFYLQKLITKFTIFC